MNTLQIINDFRRLIRDAPGELDVCNDERIMCEQAFKDVYHFCELRPRTRTNQRKISANLQEYALRRRKAKDRILELKAIVNFVNENKCLLNKLDTLAGETKKQLNYIENERHYNPKIIKNLF